MELWNISLCNAIMFAIGVPSHVTWRAVTMQSTHVVYILELFIRIWVGGHNWYNVDHEHHGHTYINHLGADNFSPTVFWVYQKYPNF